MTTAQLTLRPHQVTAVNGVHNLMRQGKRVIVLVSPTGSGKRYLIVYWGDLAAGKERDVLIVTNRQILVNQAAGELANYDIQHGIIMGGHDEQRHHRVQVASIQSLDRRYLQRDASKLPRADLLLVDETHRQVEKYAQLFSHYPNAKIIGFTATPVGPDGMSLVGPNFAEATFEAVKNSELIRDGWLLPTRVIAPSEPNIEGIKGLRKSSKTGEFNQDKLSQQVKGVTAFADIFKEWQPFQSRKTIVFAPGVAYCYGLKGGFGQGGDSFYGHGIDAEVIEAGTPQKERDAILERFENGDLNVILSVDVLREGFDASVASCAIDLQPNAQLRTWWQKVGRIKRPHPGQTEAVLIDMAGNQWRHLIHPDDDPPWDEVTDKVGTYEIVESKRQTGDERNPITCPQCFHVRKGGPTCPECGHKASVGVRRIRMGNGKLTTITAEAVKKHVKTEAEKEARLWQSSLFVGLNKGMTLAQCRGKLYKDRKIWVHEKMPCVPPKGSAQWDQRVSQVYTTADLTRYFAINRD
jgi:DNA repair protein RadD